MPRMGLEPKISTGERPKTYALDRAATGIGGLESGLMMDDIKREYRIIAFARVVW